jgi:PmbA protein
VLIGRRQACVSASDTRPETLAAMAERAVAMAREAPEDPWCGLAEPGELATAWDLAALDLDDPAPPPDPASLERAAREAEAAALAVNGVSRMDAAGASWQRSRLHLAATNGFSGGYGRTGSSIHAVAITGEGTGMERDYASRAASTPPTCRRPTRSAARRRARRRAGGRRQAPDRRLAGALRRAHLRQPDRPPRPGGQRRRRRPRRELAQGRAGRGGAARRPRPRRGPLPPPRLRLAPFDGEGLPGARRAIVAGGVLKGWTLDLASARKLGMASTGNATRGTSAPPSPGVGNLWLTPGATTATRSSPPWARACSSPALIGASINPTTGDYSRGASGFWVENGAIVRPVNECTIAGNLRDMLMTHPPGERRPAASLRVIPSLLVAEGLTIAGS